MARRPWLAVGIHLPPKPPVYSLRIVLAAARLMRLESFTVWDHFQDLFPQSLWDRELTWLATQSPTPHDFFEYQTLLGYLAAHAGRIRLGVGVTHAAARHPVVIAQSMMTLAHIAKRPPILGFGAGEREGIEPYGLPMAQPVGRMEEALQIIRQCFTSRGPMRFEGKHFRLDDAVLDLAPPKGRTPEIWVAAHGPRTLRLTGRYADAWLPVVITSPEQYVEQLAIVHEGAREAGRDPGAVLPALQQYVVVAPTERAARAMLGSRAVRLVALLAPAELWRRHGQTHPFGEQFRGFIDFIPGQYDRATLEAALAQVPLDAVEHALLWGTPEQIVARMRQYRAVGVRHVNFELVSAVVSPKAALYSIRAIGRIARELRDAPG